MSETQPILNYSAASDFRPNNEVDLAKIEAFLADKIFPELEEGRPNWDVPHTKAVVSKLKESISENPQIPVDVNVLVIAAYAHDWGYSGLFQKGVRLSSGDIKAEKVRHAQIGAEKIKELMQDPIFQNLTNDQKDRVVHLVLVHDNMEVLQDPDEIMLMEADTLGAMDIHAVAPSFDATSNEKYLEGVHRKRVPKFMTDYAKREFARLLQIRNDYYEEAALKEESN